ncbi:hypothetical protein ALDI51_11340 [Alicycliphilus denitrificans]|uniref:hypothetical protein n=1 Tax=Alicycliphilus denitrificans TaxID=179636 RepID=UPI0009606119|nr:hypothetical protein [Alicycliphilus denitrificans]MBN9572423.1 hypothetical protein [Alicycliphilus denitrificans]OJW91525.1 MAG: hypothetical protein BGO66_14930 [Alicycliphilus sp. 69-12]BCN37815.1 hypothetical protein ALDI51_11340 [Alicycliphilus denitrificans]
MSLLTPERLYQLLPAIHRLRDAEQGLPLRALLAVIEQELTALEADTARLYDNWFIETCDEWTVPYIGDLVGARPIRPVPSAGVSARAWVANTLAYRRRKGTALVLEQLARDVTGWPAAAVEFFQRLATTQHMNHVRLASAATASVRDAARADLACASAGAFDPFAHLLEVRNADTAGGRFNIPNVGIFLWRLRAQPLGQGAPGDADADFISARRSAAGWWHMHPAGVDAPLFNLPRTETGGAVTQAAREENASAPLRPLALHAELERLRAGDAGTAPVFMAGRDPVLRVFVRLAGETLPVEIAREGLWICDIPDAVTLPVPPRVAAIDVQRGRMAFPAALDVQQVWLHAAHGSAADIGGGPYDRGDALRAASSSLSEGTAAQDDAGGFFDPAVWQVGVTHLLPLGATGTLFATLRDAVQAWNALPAGRTGVIVLMDSLTESDAAPLTVNIAEGSRLMIVSGQWPPTPVADALPGTMARQPGRFEARQTRAHWQGRLQVLGTAAADALDPGALFLNGLLLQGPLDISGPLGQVELAHCTVLPGGTHITVGSDSPRLALRVLSCLAAPMAVAGPVGSVAVVDSIVGLQDAGAAGSAALSAPQAPLDLLRTSFLGTVHGLTISASDCIFDAPAVAERRQTGCVRFCYVPPASAVPRRYRCQPQLETDARIAALRAAALAAGLPPPTAAEEDAVRAEAEATVRPLFTSRRYGDPGLAQLDLRCAAQIRTGAESGAEMGAYERLRQPQREANLRDALAEYLRLGLTAGVYFAN